MSLVKYKILFNIVESSFLVSKNGDYKDDMKGSLYNVLSSINKLWAPMTDMESSQKSSSYYN